MRYLMRKKNIMVLKMSRTRCCCAYGGASSEHDMGSCTVTRQHGDDEETCVVYQAEHAPQGTCKSVIEALLWPTTYTKKIPILFGCETSVECMEACTRRREHKGSQNVTREVQLCSLWSSQRT